MKRFIFFLLFFLCILSLDVLAQDNPIFIIRKKASGALPSLALVDSIRQTSTGSNTAIITHTYSTPGANSMYLALYFPPSGGAPCDSIKVTSGGSGKFTCGDSVRYDPTTTYPGFWTYYLKSPPTGSVVITGYGFDMQFGWLWVGLYQGVNQTTPIGVMTKVGGYRNTSQPAAITISSGDIGFGVVSYCNAPATPGAPMTTFISSTGTYPWYAGINITAGLENCWWSWTGNQAIVGAAFDLKQN